MSSSAASVAFRQSRSDDITALHRVWVRAVEATHSFLAPEDFEEISGLVRDAYLPEETFWVAECDGDIAGFMGQTDQMIDALFLDPAYFGKGIGRLFIDKAKEAGLPLKVDVNEQNEGARVFYERLGFRVAGRSETDDAGRPYPLLHLIMT